MDVQRSPDSGVAPSTTPSVQTAADVVGSEPSPPTNIQRSSPTASTPGTTKPTSADAPDFDASQPAPSVNVQRAPESGLVAQSTTPDNTYSQSSSQSSSPPANSTSANVNIQRSPEPLHPAPSRTQNTSLPSQSAPSANHHHSDVGIQRSPAPIASSANAAAVPPQTSTDATVSQTQVNLQPSADGSSANVSQIDLASTAPTIQRMSESASPLQAQSTDSSAPFDPSSQVKIQAQSDSPHAQVHGASSQSAVSAVQRSPDAALTTPPVDPSSPVKIQAQSDSPQAQADGASSQSAVSAVQRLPDAALTTPPVDPSSPVKIQAQSDSPQAQADGASSQSAVSAVQRSPDTSLTTPSRPVQAQSVQAQSVSDASTAVGPSAPKANAATPDVQAASQAFGSSTPEQLFNSSPATPLQRQSAPSSAPLTEPNIQQKPVEPPQRQTPSQIADASSLRSMEPAIQRKSESPNITGVDNLSLQQQSTHAQASHESTALSDGYDALPDVQRSPTLSTPQNIAPEPTIVQQNSALSDAQSATPPSGTTASQSLGVQSAPDMGANSATAATENIRPIQRQAATSTSNTVSKQQETAEPAEFSSTSEVSSAVDIQRVATEAPTVSADGPGVPIVQRQTSHPPSDSSVTTPDGEVPSQPPPSSNISTEQTAAPVQRSPEGSQHHTAAVPALTDPTIQRQTAAAPATHITPGIREMPRVQRSPEGAQSNSLSPQPSVESGIVQKQTASASPATAADIQTSSSPTRPDPAAPSIQPAAQAGGEAAHRDTSIVQRQGAAAPAIATPHEQPRPAALDSSHGEAPIQRLPEGREQASPQSPTEGRQYVQRAAAAVPAPSHPINGGAAPPTVQLEPDVSPSTSHPEAAVQPSAKAAAISTPAADTTEIAVNASTPIQKAAEPSTPAAPLSQIATEGLQRQVTSATESDAADSLSGPPPAALSGASSTPDVGAAVQRSPAPQPVSAHESSLSDSTVQRQEGVDTHPPDTALPTASPDPVQLQPQANHNRGSAHPASPLPVQPQTDKTSSIWPESAVSSTPGATAPIQRQLTPSDSASPSSEPARLNPVKAVQRAANESADSSSAVGQNLQASPVERSTPETASIQRQSTPSDFPSPASQAELNSAPSLQRATDAKTGNSGSTLNLQADTVEHSPVSPLPTQSAPSIQQQSTSIAETPTVASPETGSPPPTPTIQRSPDAPNRTQQGQQPDAIAALPIQRQPDAAAPPIDAALPVPSTPVLQARAADSVSSATPANQSPTGPDTPLQRDESADSSRDRSHQSVNSVPQQWSSIAQLMGDSDGSASSPSPQTVSVQRETTTAASASPATPENGIPISSDTPIQRDESADPSRDRPSQSVNSVPQQWSSIAQLMGEGNGPASSPSPQTVSVQREMATAEVDKAEADNDAADLAFDKQQQQLRKLLQGALPDGDDESQLLIESLLSKAAGFETDFNEYFAETANERAENNEEFSEITREIQTETLELTEEELLEFLEEILAEEDTDFQTALADCIKESDQVILEALALRLEDADDEFLESLAETILEADVEFPEGEYLTEKGAAQELEILAREMYGLIRQRLVRDRERQGNYYAGRLTLS